MTKQIISLIAAAALLPTVAFAADAPSNTVVTAGKTAQWTNQEKASNYNLRIHGWSEWENAAYIGFTLPSDFAPDKLESAVLRLDTTWVNASSTAYIYAADYSAFESGVQYEGTANAPLYTTTEFKSFTSPAATGEFELDITEYMQTLTSAADTAAFRIDVKSQNTNNAWCIGSLTNNGTAPKLVLTYNSDEAEPGAIQNPKFANGMTGWTAEGSADASGGALVVTGSGKVSQRVTGLESGTYDLGARVKTSDISGTAYLYAKANGKTIARTAVPQSDDYMTIAVPGVSVEDGELEVGIYAADKGSATVSADDFTLTASSASRIPFLKGGEISKLTYVEDKGGKFYRADGSQADALQIMAENGFNLARIRLLDDPGKGHGDGTYYLPENYLTLEDCLSLAKRAKNKGMQIEFTIAYSDYWVDGEKQMVPYAWKTEIENQGLTGDALISYLEDKVYEYTKTSLQAMVDQGTAPEYVSVGNEIQCGILFDTWKNGNGLYYQSAPLIRFLNAGARAVREVTPDAKIILHSDNGGKVSKRTLFTGVLSKVDFDVIGVSFYPYYNADVSIDTVVNEFNTFVNQYNKDVIVMETGYNFSEKRSDTWEGQLEDNGYYQDIYGETQAGQRAFLTELYAKLKTVAGGRCIGDLYWDPVMITDNVGWAISEDGDWLQGNVISNSTIFDFNGKAVEGQKAMRDNTNSTDSLLLTGTVTDSKNKALANTAMTLTVDGTNYDIKTDAFGDYIAAIPYPSEGSVDVGIIGIEGTQTVAAPSDSFIVSDIDFKAPKDFLKSAVVSVVKTGVYDDASSAAAAAFYTDITAGADTVTGFTWQAETDTAKTPLTKVETANITSGTTVRYGLVVSVGRSGDDADTLAAENITVTPLTE